MGPVKQYVGETSNEPVTLKVYPGANGKFQLYNDDGSSFRYQQGDYMLITGEWNDSTRTLTLSRDPQGRLGANPGFNVVMAGSSQKHSVELRDATTKITL
jgi:alpha-glucosidase (family GH31 glycosyl hydrolase)